MDLRGDGEVGRVQDHQAGGTAPHVGGDRQQPAVVLGGAVPGRYERGLAQRPRRPELRRRRGRAGQVVLDQRTSAVRGGVQETVEPARAPVVGRGEIDAAVVQRLLPDVAACRVEQQAV